MNKPLKREIPSIVLTLLILGTLAGGVFMFHFFPKVEWQNPPLYSGAQQITSKVARNGQEKTTTFTVSELQARVVLNYADNLRMAHWHGGVSTHNKSYFKFIDNSKDINMPVLFPIYRNECPAFYLTAYFESVAEEVTKVTLVQTVGPCGKPHL